MCPLYPTGRGRGRIISALGCIVIVIVIIHHSSPPRRLFVFLSRYVIQDDCECNAQAFAPCDGACYELSSDACSKSLRVPRCEYRCRRHERVEAEERYVLLHQAGGLACGPGRVVWARTASGVARHPLSFRSLPAPLSARHGRHGRYGRECRYRGSLTGLMRTPRCREEREEEGGRHRRERPESVDAAGGNPVEHSLRGDGHCGD